MKNLICNFQFSTQKKAFLLKWGLLRLLLSRKKEKTFSLDQEKDKIKFHAMLLKIKKKRPNFNIDLVMRKVYDDNKLNS